MHDSIKVTQIWQLERDVRALADTSRSRAPSNYPESVVDARRIMRVSRGLDRGRCSASVVTCCSVSLISPVFDPPNSTKGWYPSDGLKPTETYLLLSSLIKIYGEATLGMKCVIDYFDRIRADIDFGRDDVTFRSGARGSVGYFAIRKSKPCPGPSFVWKTAFSRWHVWVEW